MDADDLMAKLDAIRFFEGYTPEAEREAKARIRKRYEEGLRSADRRRYFVRFPGFALLYAYIDGELGSAEDLGLVLGEFAAATFGMLRPTDVAAASDPDRDVTRLEFRVDGVRYVAETEYSSWLPEEVIEVVGKALKKHCNRLEFRPVYIPDDGQGMLLTVCTARAFKAAVKAGLLPADYHQGNDPAQYGVAASGEP